MDERVGRPIEHATGQRTLRRRRRLPWVLLLIVLVIVGIILWRHPWTTGQTPASGRHGGAADQAQSVGTATAAFGDVKLVMSGLGTVTPLATVTVRTQINGILQQVAFTEGQMVHRGDFLAQIDPRPYQALLEQAQGALARDQALLRDARLNLQRYATLNRQDSISRQQVDTQHSLVDQYVGTVLTDQAAIDTQRINLAYCHIISPVDGRVGLRQVDAGNYVTTADANGIVVVTKLHPISVIFTLPEDDLPQIERRMAAGESLPVSAWDRGNSAQISTGALETIDNVIDVTTGTVRLRATFANADNALFPNQFVNAKLLVDTLRGAVLVPNPAVQTGTPGSFVYLVKPDDTAAMRVIKTGPSDAANTAVSSGLQAGDVVVVDGADRLKDGSKVRVPQHPASEAASEEQRHEAQRQHRRGQASAADGQATTAPAGGPQSAAPPDQAVQPDTSKPQGRSPSDQR